MMGELNKFKITTIAFIMLFIFVVAAAYTNTREMAESQSKINSEQQNIYDNQYNRRNNNYSKDNYSSLSSQIEEINNRLNTLEGNETYSSESDGNMKCDIRGILTDDGLQTLSKDAAMTEARDNGAQLVLTCKF